MMYLGVENPIIPKYYVSILLYFYVLNLILEYDLQVMLT